ncbi:MAG: hypothetical protein ACTSUE_11765 [Promethearchaeota archaeon]
MLLNRRLAPGKGTLLQHPREKDPFVSFENIVGTKMKLFMFLFLNALYYFHERVLGAAWSEKKIFKHLE